MTEEQRKTETFILVALMKAATEQSTMLQKELKFQQKYRFKLATDAIDSFLKEIETQLSPEHFEQIEKVGDLYHNINIEVRNAVKELEEA